MLEDLERNDWPIEREIIEKYENEIKQAEIFLSQSKELRETSEKVKYEGRTLFCFTLYLTLLPPYLIQR